MRRVGECNRCGDCCRFFSIRLNYPPGTPNLLIEEEAKWFRYHDRIKVDIDPSRAFSIVRIISPCRNLAKLRSGRTTCEIYEQRPLGCIDWPRSPEDLRFLPRCGYRFEAEGNRGNQGKT